MALAIQININKVGPLDGTTELPALDSGLVTKSVDDEGVVVLEVDGGQSVGVFDPGSLLGSKSGDFVLQSMQVSRSGTAGAGPDDVALLGPAAPGGTSPRFGFFTLSAADNLFEGAKIIPAGYKLSFLESSTDGKHVIRMSLWPVTKLEQLGLLIP